MRVEVNEGGDVRPTKRYIFGTLVKYFWYVLFGLYVLLATYSLVFRGLRVLIAKVRCTFSLKVYCLALQSR